MPRRLARRLSHPVIDNACYSLRTRCLLTIAQLSKQPWMPSSLRYVTTSSNKAVIPSQRLGLTWLLGRWRSLPLPLPLFLCSCLSMDLRTLGFQPPCDLLTVLTEAAFDLSERRRGQALPFPQTRMLPLESPVMVSPFSENVTQRTNFGFSCFCECCKDTNTVSQGGFSSVQTLSRLPIIQREGAPQ